MERSSLKVKAKLLATISEVAENIPFFLNLRGISGLFGLTVIALVSNLSPQAAFGAGVILSRPDVIDTQEGKETFPESRFGSPPSRLDAEGRSRFVANSIEDMRQTESGNVPNSGEGLISGRRPAGLEFSQDTSRGETVKAQPVIGEPGMPHSPANLNPKPEMSHVRSGIQEVAVIAGELGFFPKTVFVTRDIPVRMFVTGASKKSLCIMMDLEGFQVRKQVRSQKIEELNFTPSRAGQFRFYCPVNGMEGTLLVKEGASSPMNSNTMSSATMAPGRSLSPSGVE